MNQKINELQPNNVRSCIERITGIELPEEWMEDGYFEISKNIPHWFDEVDELNVVLTMEELFDLKLPNPDSTFPKFAPYGLFYRCKSDTSFRDWCDEVAGWLNGRLQKNRRDGGSCYGPN